MIRSFNKILFISVLALYACLLGQNAGVDTSIDKTKAKLFMKYSFLESPKYSIDNINFIEVTPFFSLSGSFKKEFRDLFDKDKPEYNYLFAAERKSKSSNSIYLFATVIGVSSLFIKDDDTALAVSLGSLIPFFIGIIYSNECNDNLKMAVEHRNK